MSAAKYPRIFLHQVEAIVYISGVSNMSILFENYCFFSSRCGSSVLQVTPSNDIILSAHH